MLKNISKLEHKINDRVYQLICDNDSPLNEVKDSLFEFLKYVGKIEDAIKAQQQNQQNQPVENVVKQDDPPAEELKKDE